MGPRSLFGKYLLVLSLLGALFVFASTWLLLSAGSRFTDSIRGKAALVLAHVLEGAPNLTQQQRNELEEKILPHLVLHNVRVWIVDEKGEIVLHTLHRDPLPRPWGELAQPSETDKAEEAPGKRGFFENQIITVRLAGAPVRYLVMFFSPGNSAQMILTVMIVLFSLWTLLGAVLLSAALVTLFFRSKAREAVDVLRRLHRGELGARFRITRLDEVGNLMRIFNEMADEVERLDRQRTDFLREISHDLRTPLTSSYVMLETLAENFDKLGDADRKRCAASAYREMTYLRGLIEDLFCLAEMKVPELRRDAAIVDLRTLVEQAIESRAGIQWRLDLQNVELMADRGLLTRLVRNALDNAAKHARSEVSVRLAGGPDSVTLVIEDDGAGPTEDQIAGFGQRRPASVERGAFASGKSLGLGSVIMKSIVELHQGAITLSKGSGSGEYPGARLTVVLARNFLESRAA